MSNVCLSPKETTDALIQSATIKTSYSTGKRILMSVMAGAYIALGGQGFLVTYENTFLRAAVFPVGLMLIVLVGGELFTGNCLITFGLLQKKLDLNNYIKTLTQVLFGNFIGALIIVAMLYFGGVYKNPELSSIVVSVAKAKVSLTFIQILFKGILCNILVVLGVWFAATAKDTTGKIIGCWFPVMLFVLCGYEHSVANMFFLPMGALFDSTISIALILKNLTAATIGNFIGGGLIIPFIYNKVYY